MIVLKKGTGECDLGFLFIRAWTLLFVQFKFNFLMMLRAFDLLGRLTSCSHHSSLLARFIWTFILRLVGQGVTSMNASTQ